MIISGRVVIARIHQLAKKSASAGRKARPGGLEEWPPRIFRSLQYTVSRYRAHSRRSVVSLRLVDQSSSRLPSVTGPQQFATYSTFRSLGYNLLSLTSVTSHSIPHPEPPRACLSLPLFRRLTRQGCTRTPTLHFIAKRCSAREVQDDSRAGNPYVGLLE